MNTVFIILTWFFFLEEKFPSFVILEVFSHPIRHPFYQQKRNISFFHFFLAYQKFYSIFFIMFFQFYQEQ